MTDLPLLIYCFVDIETDGPSPDMNSMLSFACVAYDDAENEIAAFQRNLSRLEGTVGDPITMAWWQTQPEAWAISTRNPQPAEIVMPAFANWIRALPGAAVFAAHPLVFDGLWIDRYLRRFTQACLFNALREDSLFLSAGIDVGSYVMGALNMPYFRKRPDYPPELLNHIVHSHDPLDDARGHAALYFNARRTNAKRT